MAMNQNFYTSLYRWYDSAKRELPWRDTTDPYQIWLSEVILQQTRVKQGMDYWWRFVQRFPTVEDLAAAEEDEVLRLWQGLGYYSRARNLHKAARMIVERGWTPFPTEFEQLTQLPGVGEYSAGAIMSFAYNKPYPAVDGNVYRVLARLFYLDDEFDTAYGKKVFREKAWELLDRQQPRLYNSAIMELGALFCEPGCPDCERCPLVGSCEAYRANVTAYLPVRKERVEVKSRWLLYRIPIDAQGHTLIHRREGKDIWHHLWEFPLQEFPTRKALNAAVAEVPPTATISKEVKHALSHQRLHTRFLIERTEQLPAMDGFIEVPFSKLDDYALPRLIVKQLEEWTAML